MVYKEETLESEYVFKGKLINVAYDDSGSMYANTRWCNAKYGLEVLAAMLNALAQCVIVISHLLVCPAMRTGPRAKTGIARTAFVEHHDALALVSRCGCGVQAGKTAADNQYIAFVFGFCRSFDFGDWQLSSNTLNELRFISIKEVKES